VRDRNFKSEYLYPVGAVSHPEGNTCEKPLPAPTVHLGPVLMDRFLPSTTSHERVPVAPAHQRVTNGREKWTTGKERETGGSSVQTAFHGQLCLYTPTKQLRGKLVRFPSALSFLQHDPPFSQLSPTSRWAVHRAIGCPFTCLRQHTSPTSVSRCRRTSSTVAALLLSNS